MPEWEKPVLHKRTGWPAEAQHAPEVVSDPSLQTAVITLYPQEGCPIVRALVVSSVPGINVHFEAAADGTLLVRIR